MYNPYAPLATNMTAGTFRVTVRNHVTGSSDRVVISGPIEIQWVSTVDSGPEDESPELARAKAELLKRHLRDLSRLRSLVVARCVPVDRAPRLVPRREPGLDHQQRCSTRLGQRYRRRDRRTGRVFVPPTRA